MKAWCIRRPRLALFLWNTLGLAMAAVAMFSSLIRAHPLLAVGVFLFYLFWTSLGSRYMTALHLERLQQATVALYDRCDPDPLLRLSEEALAAAPQGRAKGPYLSACAMNRMTSLYALGRFAEAIDACPAGPLAPTDPAGRLVLQVNLANLHLAMNHPDTALELIDQATQALKALPADFPNRQVCQDAIDSFSVALRLLRGELEGLLPVLESGLDAAQTEYQRVGAHFQLGRYYLKAGQPHLARPHLEYVAQHGNRLYYRSDAQEYLKELQEPPQT